MLSQKSDDGNMPGKQVRNIICYNVGGKIFEITRDIVERYPTSILATSAAEASNADSAVPIFIQGNNERFTYVLEYLHTGRAVLPRTIAKNAFLQDLQSYGIQNVEPSTVGVGYGGATGVVNDVLHIYEKYAEGLEALDAELCELELKRSCYVVAHECFKWCIINGLCRPVQFRNDDVRDDVEHCFLYFNQQMFNEQLAWYGLTFDRQEGDYERENFEVWLKQLDKTSEKSRF